MKAILRTDNYQENYQIVEILKNPVSSKNILAEVRLEDGSVVYTGGVLCEVREKTIEVLNTLTNKEQWDWLCSIKAPNSLYVTEHLKQQS